MIALGSYCNRLLLVYHHFNWDHHSYHFYYTIITICHLNKLLNLLSSSETYSFSYKKIIKKTYSFNSRLSLVLSQKKKKGCLLCNNCMQPSLKACGAELTSTWSLCTMKEWLFIAPCKIIFPFIQSTNFKRKQQQQ